jgi:hypothetical protein
MDRLQAFFAQRDALEQIDEAFPDLRRDNAEHRDNELDGSHSEKKKKNARARAGPVIVALGEADSESDFENTQGQHKERVVSKIKAWPTDGWDPGSSSSTQASPAAAVNDHLSAYNRGAISERSSQQHATTSGGTLDVPRTNEKSSSSLAGGDSEAVPFRFWVPRSSDDTPRHSARSENAIFTLASARRGQDPMERQERRHMRHLDVPVEGFEQFKEFVKELVEHVHLECAPANPYVQALNAHRMELEQAQKIDDEADSLAMRLATRHDGLATMDVVDEPLTPCAAVGIRDANRTGSSSNGAKWAAVWPPLGCVGDADGRAIESGLASCSNWDVPADDTQCSSYIYRQSPEDIPEDIFLQGPHDLQSFAPSVERKSDEPMAWPATHEAYVISHM